MPSHVGDYSPRSGGAMRCFGGAFFQGPAIGAGSLSVPPMLSRPHRDSAVSSWNSITMSRDLTLIM
jgi:hypothetical protein